MQQTSNTKSYDVFISCKSEDYVYAEQIYDYLVEHDFRVFLASRELRKLGDSEYRRAIISALKSAYHLIVFSSKPEYIESEWVYYEWDAFINAKLKGFKQGNIFTILKDVLIEDISMDLWKYESMSLDNYKETLLNYVETPEHKLLKEKLEQERQQKEESEKALRELKKQLEQTYESFYEQQVKLDTIERSKIASILHKLKISNRSCPACQNGVELEEEYCHWCGYKLDPIDGIKEFSNLTIPNSKRIGFHQAIFQKVQQANTIEKELLRYQKEAKHIIDELKENNYRLNHKIESAIQTENALKNEKEQISHNLTLAVEKEKDAKQKLNKVSAQVTDMSERISYKDLQIAQLNKKLKESETRLQVISTLSSELKEAKSQIALLTKTIEQYKTEKNNNKAAYPSWNAKTDSSLNQSATAATTSAHKISTYPKYHILFRTLSSENRPTLFKYITEILNCSLSEAKRLVDNSLNNYVKLPKEFSSETDVENITKQIMSITSASAIWKRQM